MVQSEIDQVCDRIRSVCSGRSCREIAELTNTSGETVRRYLHGSAPSVVFVRGLCDNFHLSSDWLLFGIEPIVRSRSGGRSVQPASVALRSLIEQAGERVPG